MTTSHGSTTRTNDQPAGGSGHLVERATPEPRIAPGTRREVGVVNWLISAASGAVARTPPPNLFLTLGRQRGLFRAWMWFAGHLMPGGKLGRRTTELVILRVAELRGCEYELEHHRSLAQRSGVSAEEVERVSEGPDAAGWTDRERAILAAVDELHHTNDLSDDHFAALETHLDAPRIVELVMLVGHYEMLATAITALRVQPDPHHR